MARQTRQQRRQRRQQDGIAPAAAAPPRAPRGPVEAELEEQEPRQPERRPAVARVQERPGRLQFFKESYAELRKVEWPRQRQVIQGTVVVLIACLIVGVFLYASDQAFKHLVENVFLR
jgi:preprotein translocase subunit SecE